MRLKLLIVGALAGAAAPLPAAANPYEAFIDIETEEDIYDLLASQQITEETFETLVDLFHRGVDLNTAGREELYSLPNLTYDDVDAILAYRKEQGFILDPAELVAAQVITDDKLLAAAAFLVVRDPFAGQSKVHGRVLAQTRFTVGDDILPPLALGARVLSGRDLTAGVAVIMTRLRPGDVVYDPNRDALLADGIGNQVHAPKLYVAYETDDLHAIAGTFRAGFAQKLTFDNSSDYTPNGIYRDDQIHYDGDLSRACPEGRGELGTSPCDDSEYVSSDYKWREGMLGVAGGLKHLEVGDGWLQLYGWGSYQPRSIYQYELFDATSCDNPRTDADECGAPDVFVRPDGDRLQPTTELQYSTLPEMYAEALVGGNASYFLSRRNYVGVTGYAARVDWLVDDGVDGGDADQLRLDFQEWSSRPSGGTYGAIGLATAAGVGRFDLGAEVAHSFDSMLAADDGAANGGGGPGVLVRSTFTEPKRHEVELTLRYYDVDFVNPHARPIAASDEFEGFRARDEIGARLRFTGKIDKLTLRSTADVWTNPSEDGRAETKLSLRGDNAPSKAISYGLWLDFQSTNSLDTGDGVSDIEDVEESIDFQIQKLATTARLRWQVDKRLGLSWQVRHDVYEVEDVAALEGQKIHDLSAWMTALYRASDRLRLRGRIRYLSEDVADPDSLEESLWAYVDATQRLRAKDRLRLRVDLFQYLDDRARTAERDPNPEIRLLASYEAKF